MEEAPTPSRARRAALLPLLFLAAWLTPAPAQEGSAAEGAATSELVYRVDDLEPWLGEDMDTSSLRTPQTALQTFLTAVREERFEDAAGVLNLADLPADERREEGPRLAERLGVVIDRRVDVDWRELPDRPDGWNDVPDPFAAAGEGGGSGAPTPRRNLLVGLVELGDAESEVRLERVRVADGEPVWLVARSTVRTIDAMYDRHGPGWLDEVVPEWALRQYARTPLWQWVGLALLVGFSVLVGIGVQRLAARLMRHSERRWMRGLAEDVARPLAMLVTVATAWLASTSLLPLTGPPSRWLTTVLAVLLVVALTWLGMSTINFFSEYVGKRHVDLVAEQDEPRARRHLTYLSVARRAFVFLVMLLGLGIVLAQFDAFRTVGTSLLASAGVAGIVLGVAAQDSLANVMAGIQIALTQLVSIGDTVFVEGEWAYIEDITYTYVVVRTWDQRRIAIPNKHVISNPLENWEMTSSHQTMSVMLHVDYRTPIEELRRTYVELLETAEDWDREVDPSLQVIDVSEDVVTIRVLCSAADAGTAWVLHCWLRERMVEHLREWEGGRYLPRRRLEVDQEAALPLAPR